jgi:hypothetical protein
MWVCSAKNDNMIHTEPPIHTGKRQNPTPSTDEGQFQKTTRT